jgi:hypothetical protein
MKLPRETEHGQDRRNLINRRRYPRYPVSSAAEAADIQGDRKISGRLSDISRNGCYLDTINPFDREAAVALTIISDKQSIKTRAKVVYSQIGMGMGLSFTTTEPEQVHLLERWLGELGGGEQPGPDSPKTEIRVDSTKSTDPVLRDIFAELIVSLSLKGILNDLERKAMLQKLSQ